MTSVFLDTAGLVAVVNVDDHWHAPALAVWKDLHDRNCRLVTTSLVLIEIGDGLSKIQHRNLAIDIYDRLRHAPHIEIVSIAPPIEERAWGLFRKRPDKEWGITDCVSFLVMQERFLADAFTVDRHFEQAGFNPLIRA